MPAHMGMQLFIFSLLVLIGYNGRLVGFETTPPGWMTLFRLLGAFGLSAVLSSLLVVGWKSAVATYMSALRSGSEATPFAPPPQEMRDTSETTAMADLLRDSGLIDSAWYLGTYPDVADAGYDPALHYLLHGAAEGRNPNPFFDTSWYLDHNPDVREEGINPLLHYLTEGVSEGRAAGPRFDTAFYRAENPDVNLAEENPLAHFIRTGRFEGRPSTRHDGSV